MSAMKAAVITDVPVTGEVHEGGQRVTTMPPFTPFLPMWMWAPIAGPDRCFQVSFQVSVVPVSVAVKRPAAPTFVPFGCGFSCPTLSAALNLTGRGVLLDATEPIASM